MTTRSSQPFRPQAAVFSRPPVRTMDDLCTILQLNKASISARLAVHAKLGRPVPAPFRPNGRGTCYYNPREFKAWVDACNGSTNTATS